MALDAEDRPTPGGEDPPSLGSFPLMAGCVRIFGLEVAPFCWQRWRVSSWQRSASTTPVTELRRPQIGNWSAASGLAARPRRPPVATELGAPTSVGRQVPRVGGVAWTSPRHPRWCCRWAPDRARHPQAAQPAHSVAGAAVRHHGLSPPALALEPLGRRDDAQHLGVQIVGRRADLVHHWDPPMSVASRAGRLALGEGVRSGSVTRAALRRACAARA